MLEDNLLVICYSLIVNYINGDWCILGCMNYVGSIYEDYLDFGLFIDNVSVEFIFDMEVGYYFIDDL